MPVQDLSHPSGGFIVCVSSKNQARPSFKKVANHSHLTKSSSFDESIDMIFGTGTVGDYAVK